jgi:4-carboxymuconolactone decarboxylase
MAESDRVLVRLSRAMADRDDPAIEAELRRAAESTSPERVDETVLLACLFLGFPATLETALLGAWLGGPPSRTVARPAEPTLEEIEARGVELCRRVYGSAYEGLRANVAEVHPALDRWMVLDGYGRVLSRAGLEPRVRELCIVAMLAARDWERQLHSHLRGALRLGAPPDHVAEALAIGVVGQSTEVKRRLTGLWKEVRERSERLTDVH